MSSELKPLVELPADSVVLHLEHVEDCCCRYVASPKDTTDVKLIDTRCMSTYWVPGKLEPGDRGPTVTFAS